MKTMNQNLYKYKIGDKLICIHKRYKNKRCVIKGYAGRYGIFNNFKEYYHVEFENGRRFSRPIHKCYLISENEFSIMEIIK